MTAYRKPANNVQSMSCGYRESFLTQCPVCHNIYTNPKKFPCGHTLCLGCIQHILQHHGVVVCPLCKVEVQIPDGGPTNLPKDIFLQLYLDRVCYSQESYRVRPTCYTCQLNGMEITASKCCKCCKTKPLCELCAENHSGKFKDHDIIDIEGN